MSWIRIFWRPLALQFHVEPHAPQCRWLDTQSSGSKRLDQQDRNRSVHGPRTGVACTYTPGRTPCTGRAHLCLSLLRSGSPRGTSSVAGHAANALRCPQGIEYATLLLGSTTEAVPRETRCLACHVGWLASLEAYGVEDHRTTPPRGGEIQMARKGVGFPVHAKLSTARIMRPTANSGPTPYISLRARPVIAVHHSRAAGGTVPRVSVSPLRHDGGSVDVPRETYQRPLRTALTEHDAPREHRVHPPTAALCEASVQGST